MLPATDLPWAQKGASQSPYKPAADIILPKKSVHMSLMA